MTDTVLPVDSDTLPPEAANEAAAGSTPPKKPRRRWLRRLLSAFLLLLTLLVAAVVWLVGTESGLRFGITKIPSWFGVNISVKELTGSLWRGFQGSGIQVATEGTDLDISSVALQWQPNELWQRQLHVNRLAAGDIRIISKQFVLGGTRQSDIARNTPDTATFVVLYATYAISVFFNTSTLNFFNLLYKVKINAFGCIDPTS